jgi:ABC-2 type transport system ATP-binding protein
MSDTPIEALGLVKRYGERTAVAGVDITVRPGDVYGYLGPNGAGKTTSLRMMLGLITPTAGTARLFGRDPHLEGARALDGVAGFVEAPRFYPYLTARKNLELCAAFDGDGASARIGEALDTVDLTDRAGDRVGGYSHGMKQRLGIAAALLRRPRLLILDEPTTGLDPAGMRDMRELVRRLAGEGLTVLLSSHLMAEVEELCNRVAIIRLGTILYEGGLDELLSVHGPSHRLRTRRPADAAAVAERMGVTASPGGEGDLWLDGGDEAVERLTVELGRAGIGILELTRSRASLEQLFLQLTEGGPEPAPEPVVEQVA